ncbi:hypothetical protein HTV45_21580 [Streptomyces sp. CHD11]|uniref:MHYT domain-containing protein n=1 Tax=Streptomyces sp. CHD11 TaxID=2741325 RepID=UPI001BFC272B|nr:MHYT domain-containing protein [Streptomyces sp. CHD11]MBT3153428.1 hypothetical protein [Streptomyces sp. CHD11]
MQGTVDGFSYGLVTPLAAYLVACLGGALGLRCTTRSLRTDGNSWKPGWLALGAASIGCGIWTMHFIAMLGFSVDEVSIRYDIPLTLLSLAVAIVVVGIGVFIVGYLGVGRVALLTAGTVTGLGVAGMHYLGMASMRMSGAFEYQPALVALSVVIAVVAATSALWAAVSVRGFLPSLGASMIMGIAVTGMHYTGMSAMTVHLHGEGGGSGAHMMSVVLPMLLGPLVFLLFATAVVMFDPLLISGDDGRPLRPSGVRATGRAGAAEAVAGPPAAPAPAPNGPVPPTAYAGDFPAAQAGPWAQGAGDVPRAAPRDAGRDGDRPSGW